jgi:nitroreductase
MNVSEAIRTRRSVRHYDPREVEQEKLDLVLEAARLSPSAANQQQWKFILVRDKELLEKLYIASENQPSVKEAPAAIVVCATGNRVMTCGQPTETVDPSIATSYLILQAHELGLGTCWLGRFHAEQVKDALAIPEDVTVVAVTPIGYPAEEPPARPRKTAAEVISYDKY